VCGSGNEQEACLKQRDAEITDRFSGLHEEPKLPGGHLEG
jgi:hypothetical protein